MPPLADPANNPTPNPLIGLTGASGFLGQLTAQALDASGASVVAFSRQANRTIPHTSATRQVSLEDAADVSGLDAIIHLAGEPILGRWTPAKRERLWSSRVDLTRRLVSRFKDLASPPRTLICASAVGYYGDRAEEQLQEDSARGEGFLPELVGSWEHAADAASKYGTRVVNIRIGVVLGRKGGAFPLLRRVFSLGLGGRLGDGLAWMPWVHADDVVGLIMAALDHDSWSGPINAVAPGIVQNFAFTSALGAALRRPTPFPAPAFALRIVLGEMADVILSSQRVAPARALELGYNFKFADLPSALDDLTS
jgi:uncharacterized protein